MARSKVFLNNKYDYNIFVTSKARFKMETYCSLSEGEIGWLGFVKRDGLNFIIEDVVLLKQQVHAATTEIDPKSLLELWGSLSDEQSAKLKIWGHSHVNMEPNPSGQDNDQMEYFKENDWFIRLITNKKGKYHIDIYDYMNGVKVHFDDTDLKTYIENQGEIEDSIIKEIKEKVTEKKIEAPKQYQKSFYDYTPAPINKNLQESPDNKQNLGNIMIEYVSNLEDIITDPNYWQQVDPVKK